MSWISDNPQDPAAYHNEDPSKYPYAAANKDPSKGPNEGDKDPKRDPKKDPKQDPYMEPTMEPGITTTQPLHIRLYAPWARAQDVGGHQS